MKCRPAARMGRWRSCAHISKCRVARSGGTAVCTVSNACFVHRWRICWAKAHACSETPTRAIGRAWWGRWSGRSWWCGCDSTAPHGVVTRIAVCEARILVSRVQVRVGIRVSIGVKFMVREKSRVRISITVRKL